MTPTVAISPWIDAPTLRPGRRLAAIGDVHGCAVQLAALLDALRTTCDEDGEAARTTLVWLGDVIDRGPDSLATLMAYAAPAREHGFADVVRLLGNHEQMMRLAVERRDLSLWLANGGRAACVSFGVVPDQRTLAAGLNREMPGIMDVIDVADGHLRSGNLVLVHAGINPAADLATFLAQPWDGGLYDENHWAWIRWPFLGHTEDDFDGVLVVHGHTPEHRVLRWMGEPDAEPHRLRYGRLNLDAGSYDTGRVAAAILEDGRYRVFVAAGPT